MSKNYNSTLQLNNTDLQAILDTINNLPEAGEGGTVETCTLTIESNIRGDLIPHLNDLKFVYMNETSNYIVENLPTTDDGEDLFTSVFKTYTVVKNSIIYINKGSSEYSSGIVPLIDNIEYSGCNYVFFITDNAEIYVEN